jgi:hypothetical protein
MATDKSEPRTDNDNTVVARLLANHRRFLDFLTARVGKREDAEEILQEAFVRGLQKAGEARRTFLWPPSVKRAHGDRGGVTRYPGSNLTYRRLACPSA